MTLLQSSAGLLSSSGSLLSTPSLVTLRPLWALIGTGFIKEASNPVLAKGAGGTWDDWAVRELGVVVDEDGYQVEESDGFWAYYWGRDDGPVSGTLKIGLAKSTDGITWTRYGSNPVISPSGVGGSWYETHIHEPSTIKLDNGTRYMAAAGIDSGGNYEMGMFSSADGLSWSDEGSIFTPASFAWNTATGISAVAVPSLIKRQQGDYLILFEGLKVGDIGGQWSIFGATAPSLPGTWTPLNGGYPIMAPLIGWESNGVANPRVVQLSDGTYLMAYNGNDRVGGVVWKIGFAWSDNLLNWTRHPSNPRISASGSGWDDDFVETSFLVKDTESEIRLYYHGFSSVDGSHQVGLATA